MHGIKVYSWGDTTGYAVAGQGYLRLLASSGTPLIWQPMMPGPHGYQTDDRPTCAIAGMESWLGSTIDYDTVLIHSVPETYGPILAQERALGKRIFGYTVWELETLPAGWPAILNQLDGVLVPTRWNAELFRRAGVTVPLHVVPHVSQFDGSRATLQDHELLARRWRRPDQLDGRTVFYTVGYYSARKAPHLVVDAFLNAFDGDDPVALVVKTSQRDVTRYRRSLRSGFRRRFPSPTWDIGRRTRSHPRPALVEVLATEDLTDGEMLALHEVGDCFVSLARSEGWGLGAFEAARIGNPVVMTGWGGHLDYLDPELTALVDYTFAPAVEPIWGVFGPDAQWPDADVAHASRLMAEFAARPEPLRKAAALQAARIQEEYSETRVRTALLEALS